MNLKRLLALLLAVMMVFSLVGCSSSSDTSDDTSEEESEDEDEDEEDADSEDEEEEDSSEEVEEDPLEDIIPTETVTLDVYDQLANYSGEQIGWFAQIMLEKFNVVLNIIPESDGTYETRMASGDLGDMVIWGDDSDEYLAAVEQGMLFNWEEDDLLSEYGSYIEENMATALEKNRTISGDGNIYGFGHAVAVSSDDKQDTIYTWDIRWDLYAELGYPEIADLDDLVDVLAQMKEICPTDDNGNTTYGVSLFADWDGDMVMFVKSTASAYYGYDEFGIGLYDPEEHVYYGALEEDGPYIEMLEFYNKLYRNGLLDPDSQTQGYDGMVEDYQNGTAFMNIFNFLGSTLYNTDDHLSEGKAMYSCPPEGATPIAYGLSVYGGNRPWTIGANTEYPELIMSIYNWLCTPEGKMTYEYGPENVTWYYDDDGNCCLTELGLLCMQDSSTELTGDYSGTFSDGDFKINNDTWDDGTLNTDSNGDVYDYTYWESYLESTSDYDILIDWKEYTGCETQDDYATSYGYSLAPGTDYSTSAMSDELTVTWNQVTTALKEYSWRAIYADSEDEFDELVAEMISVCEEYGYEECYEFMLEEAEIRAAAEDAALAE